jgi:hypothetical protein
MKKYSSNHKEFKYYNENIEIFKGFVKGSEGHLNGKIFIELLEYHKGRLDENIQWFEVLFENGVMPYYKFVKKLLDEKCPKLLTRCMDIIKYQNFNIGKLIERKTFPMGGLKREDYYNNIAILAKYGEKPTKDYVDKFLFRDQDLDVAELFLKCGWVSEKWLSNAFNRYDKTLILLMKEYGISGSSRAMYEAFSYESSEDEVDC